MGMPLLSVEHVGFSYDRQQILQDISFNVEKGEVFCLLGPNGCGKTTLIDCILGVQRFKSGRIRVSGESIVGIPPGTLARSISYVPQCHERTFPYTVLEIVMMGRAAYTGLFSGPKLADRRIAELALESIGIAHLKTRPYTRLSGGEGQLVMIARAIAQSAPLVIMDEPTAHLDYKNELMVLENIAGLVRERGISVIMATHFPNHAFFFENNAISTTVAMLKDTRFIEIGAPETVLRAKEIKTLYGIQADIITYWNGSDRPGKQVIPIRTLRQGA
ncbi:MAG: ABC transporter ATP-binding protein [Desulfobacterales bacterium]|nr:ABC transporter ATP-binding protein [Desulfobacterales bacterium]